eukprot:363500-Chlamydomonas_euryale.AAC.9
MDPCTHRWQQACSHSSVRNAHAGTRGWKTRVWAFTDGNMHAGTRALEARMQALEDKKRMRALEDACKHACGHSRMATRMQALED